MTMSISLLISSDSFSPARQMVGMLRGSEYNADSSSVNGRLVVTNFKLCSYCPDARLDV